jgi:hypothetical protein
MNSQQFMNLIARRTFLRQAGICSAAMVLNGCSIFGPRRRGQKDDDELRAFISGMEHLPTQTDGSVESSPQISYDGDNQITKKHFNTTLTVTELAGFNPNIGVIWPGALVQGVSLKGGVLAPINVKRSPATLVLSTLGIPAEDGKTHQVSCDVQNPKASTVETARSSLVQNGFIVPAKLAQVFKQFYSLDHAMMQVGASASYLGNSVKAQLDSEKFVSQANLMVAFTQEYYTVAMEAPTSPVSYFGDGVTVKDLKDYADKTTNPIGYVESVTYGRMALLMSSSRESYSTLRRALDAHIQWSTGNADAHYSDEEKKIVRESEVNLLLLGGSPAKGLRLIPTTDEALKAVAEWLKNRVAKPEDIQLGLPISYRVNYLKDNQVARLSFTTSYDRIDVSPIPEYTDWNIAFNTADDDKDDDTALHVEVTSGGYVIAHHDENGEKFDNGSSKSRGLNKDRRLFVKDAGDIKLSISIAPNGNDTWDFNFTLTARNSGGGPNYVKSGHMRLSEGHRSETN